MYYKSVLAGISLDYFNYVLETWYCI